MAAKNYITGDEVRQDPLDAALAYAAQGLEVFPCASDKTPLTRHGFKDATTDPDQIRAWWTKYPNALIAMPTGVKFAVLDLDVKNDKGGLSRVPDWAQRSPCIARTPSGGVHLYFSPDGAPHCTTDEIALGVDTRGLGGYVIVPPSPGYTWVNGGLKLAALPPWPDDLRPVARDEPHTPGDEQQADPALVAAAIAAIPPAGIGGRDMRVRIGMAIHAATGGSEVGFDIWWTWLQRCGAEHTRKAQARWRGFRPHSIGVGTLFYEANLAAPGWLERWDAQQFEKLERANRDSSAALFQLFGIPPPPKPEPEPPKPEPPRKYTLVRASDVVPRAKNWLWKGHLLRGALELLTGVPGVGKSQTQCKLIASATTDQPWPDGAKSEVRGNVIMITCEDTEDQEIVPRLIAAGADRQRVLFLKKIKKDKKERMFLLNEDVELLAQIINDVGDVVMITIDPITAYMGKLDAHRATDVRGQLGPLAEMAERTQVAFSAITHPAKAASQRAIDHFIGSQAFIAAARIGHVCIEELDEEKKPTGRVLFTNAKNNPHTKMSTLAYRIAAATVGQDPITNEIITAPHVVFDAAPVNITADQALAAAAAKADSTAAAKAFLLTMLDAGTPVKVKDIYERGKAAGFSEDQLKRAKEKIGDIEVTKGSGFPTGEWFWQQRPF
jgi:hypothetical protein